MYGSKDLRVQMYPQISFYICQENKVRKTRNTFSLSFILSFIFSNKLTGQKRYENVPRSLASVPGGCLKMPGDEHNTVNKAENDAIITPSMSVETTVTCDNKKYKCFSFQPGLVRVLCASPDSSLLPGPDCQSLTINSLTMQWKRTNNSFSNLGDCSRLHKEAKRRQRRNQVRK